MVVCASGISRKELVLIEKQDFDPKRGTIIVGSKKQSKKGDMTFRTIVLPTEVGKALREHHKSLSRSEKMLFPIFGEIDRTYGYRWVECREEILGTALFSRSWCDNSMSEHRVNFGSGTVSTEEDRPESRCVGENDDFTPASRRCSPNDTST